MEIGLMKKLRTAKAYIKFYRTFKRCGQCYHLAKEYKDKPEQMADLKDKLCPNCSSKLNEAGKSIKEALK